MEDRPIESDPLHHFAFNKSTERLVNGSSIFLPSSFQIDQSFSTAAESSLIHLRYNDKFKSLKESTWVGQSIDDEEMELNELGLGSARPGSNACLDIVSFCRAHVEEGRGTHKQLTDISLLEFKLRSMARECEKFNNIVKWEDFSLSIQKALRSRMITWYTELFDCLEVNSYNCKMSESIQIVESAVDTNTWIPEQLTSVQIDALRVVLQMRETAGEFLFATQRLQDMCYAVSRKKLEDISFSTSQSTPPSQLNSSTSIGNDVICATTKQSIPCRINLRSTTDLEVNIIAAATLSVKVRDSHSQLLKIFEGRVGGFVAHVSAGRFHLNDVFDRELHILNGLEFDVHTPCVVDYLPLCIKVLLKSLPIGLMSVHLYALSSMLARISLFDVVEVNVSPAVVAVSSCILAAMTVLAAVENLNHGQEKMKGNNDKESFFEEDEARTKPIFKFNSAGSNISHININNQDTSTDSVEIPAESTSSNFTNNNIKHQFSNNSNKNIAFIQQEQEENKKNNLFLNSNHVDEIDNLNSFFLSYPIASMYMSPASPADTTSTSASIPTTTANKDHAPNVNGESSQTKEFNAYFKSRQVLSTWLSTVSPQHCAQLRLNLNRLLLDADRLFHLIELDFVSTALSCMSRLHRFWVLCLPPAFAEIDAVRNASVSPPLSPLTNEFFPLEWRAQSLSATFNRFSSTSEGAVALLAPPALHDVVRRLPDDSVERYQKLWRNPTRVHSIYPPWQSVPSPPRVRLLPSSPSMSLDGKRRDATQCGDSSMQQSDTCREGDVSENGLPISSYPTYPLVNDKHRNPTQQVLDNISTTSKKMLLHALSNRTMISNNNLVSGDRAHLLDIGHAQQKQQQQQQPHMNTPFLFSQDPFRLALRSQQQQHHQHQLLHAQHNGMHLFRNQHQLNESNPYQQHEESKFLSRLNNHISPSISAYYHLQQQQQHQQYSNQYPPQSNVNIDYNTSNDLKGHDILNSALELIVSQLQKQQRTQPPDQNRTSQLDETQEHHNQQNTPLLNEYPPYSNFDAESEACSALDPLPHNSTHTRSCHAPPPSPCHSSAFRSRQVPSNAFQMHEHAIPPPGGLLSSLKLSTSAVTSAPSPRFELVHHHISQNNSSFELRNFCHEMEKENLKDKATSRSNFGHTLHNYKSDFIPNDVNINNMTNLLYPSNSCNNINNNIVYSIQNNHRVTSNPLQKTRSVCRSPIMQVPLQAYRPQEFDLLKDIYPTTTNNLNLSPPTLGDATRALHDALSISLSLQAQSSHSDSANSALSQQASQLHSKLLAVDAFLASLQSASAPMPSGPEVTRDHLKNTFSVSERLFAPAPGGLSDSYLPSEMSSSQSRHADYALMAYSANSDIHKS